MIFIQRKYTDNIYLFKDLITYGSLDTPVIKKVTEVDFEADIIPFNYVLSYKGLKRNVGVHFFIDDYQFERIWKRPLVYIERLKKFKFIFSPDFSLYRDFPKAYQIYNHFRKHAFASLAQINGLKVIPTLTWSDEDSFNWCFDGIERGSIVAVSSVGSMQNKLARETFIKGFKKAIEVLDPFKVIYFGVLPEELKSYSNIIILKKAFQEKHRESDVI